MFCWILTVSLPSENIKRNLTTHTQIAHKKQPPKFQSYPLGRTSDCQLLQVFHKDLQTDIVRDDWSLWGLDALGIGRVVAGRGIHFG